MDDSDVLSKSDRRTSNVWKYFEVHDDENKTAACNRCNHVFSYKGTVTNLRNHYEKKHGIVISTRDSDNEDIEEKMLEHENTSIRKHKRTSVLWQVFKVIDDYAKVALCRICHKPFSYRSSIGNLKRHLRCRHTHVFLSMANGEDIMPIDDSDHEDNVEPEVDTKSNNNNKERKKSKAWKYFTKSDVKKYLARCNLCHKDFSYFSISNLVKHIKRKHGLIVTGDSSTDDDVAAVLGSGHDHHEESKTELKIHKRNRQNRGKTWKYFTKTTNYKAQCNICSQELSYFRSASNLLKHFKRKHGLIGTEDSTDDELEGLGSGDEDNQESKTELKIHKSKGIRKYKSKAWKYFTKTTKHKAQCNICSQELSYYSSVTNLTTHVKRKHGLLGTEDNTDYELEGLVGSGDEDNQSEKYQAMVWLYFKCLDPVLKISMCLICKKRLEYVGVSNLKKHLVNKHPMVKLPDEEGDCTEKEMLLAEDGQLYEIETTDNNDDLEDKENETAEMDTVYLEDYIDDEPIDDKPIMKRKKEKNNTVNTKIIDKNSSSDEEISLNKYKRREDSLDHFAKYATSLLRQLPKNISDQLQMDFIKDILNAKITMSQPVAVLPSSSYSITITNQDGNSVDENK